MTRQTVIRHDDDLGGIAYPFLPAGLEWEIVSRPLGNAELMKAICEAPAPTLRWVKGDKVLDLVARSPLLRRNYNRGAGTDLPAQAFSC